VKVTCPSSGKKGLEGSWYFRNSSKKRCGRLENQSLKVLTSGKGPTVGIDSKNSILWSLAADRSYDSS
jgi:hypothetical protein